MPGVSAMTMGPFTLKYFVVICVFFTLHDLERAVFAQEESQILDLFAIGEIGSSATVSCHYAPENGTVQWLLDGKPLLEDKRFKTVNESKLIGMDADGNKKLSIVSNVTITNVTSEESGNYTCVVRWQNVTKERTTVLDLSFPGKLVEKTPGPLRKNISENADLECIFEIYEPPKDIKWWKSDKDTMFKERKGINARRVASTHKVHITSPADGGIYHCEIWDSVTNSNITGDIEVQVLDKPTIVIDTVKAIGAHKLFLNWTVHNNNLPIARYTLKYKKVVDTEYHFSQETISTENTSWVMDNLEKSTEYQVAMEVKNSYGSSYYSYPQAVKTLEKDPNFVPNITINGFSATSVTIGWAPPPDDIAPYIHYYELKAQKQNDKDNKRAYHSRDMRNLPYMFDDLEPYTTYTFWVRACSEYTRTCGNSSEPNVAMTLDGIPGKPSNVTITCYDADVRTRQLNLTWEPPRKPNAEIKGYAMELTSNATYIDQFGIEKLDTWGPLSKFATNTSRSVRFDELKPNTNYTLKLSAMTRTRRRGEEETRYCRTSPAPPDQPPRPKWRKIFEKEKYYFKLFLPRVTERNGPICCYRVYIVRLPPHKELKDLPSPEDIPIFTYEDAHADRPEVGAYITDYFSNKNFPQGSEIVLGDDKSTTDDTVCERCLIVPRRVVIMTPAPPTTTSTQQTTTPKEGAEEEEEDYDLPPTSTPETDEAVDGGKKERRSVNYNVNNFLYKEPSEKWRDEMHKYAHIMKDLASNTPIQLNVQETIQVKDGLLDSMANYTVFVELIPANDKDEAMYSTYQGTLMPAPNPPALKQANVLEVVLQVTCGVLALVLLALVLVCAVHMRRTRKMAHNNVEMNSLQATLSSLYQSLKGGRHQLVSAAPPDMPPVPVEELPAAYAERQADSDYGFQKEFEMLPDCFADRTTHASEARENQPKNRYPDIKAYDQTRVKLSQIDSVVGSDYINANYVMGYKEHKKFICAQGPTESTVNDFWRMIWEHGLELIVMLTNLEEYSKVKCCKYWPDEVRGARAFGAITVQHVSEKRYSDYIVRELKITKQPTNAEGQPIVENNGIAKRNGDCKDSSPGGSAPSSPRDWGKETSDGGPTERIVRQYHFLMWKDFAAPEHPYSILKFIKRVNEAWSLLLGRPAVVHCSAGVGRTGTLVALDYLLQQMRAEQQVSVFNTVAELRRQRNFLVQSLKQYIFVYRALVEYAHYGDTEIQASKLKTSVDRLRNTPEGADKCLMEVEFERMLTAPVAEAARPCAVAASEDVRPKNRSADCLPYDRNRVILTPLPGKDYSTYINASFIEAYDNSEGYIITQDPLPSTIFDFWRMVSEHNVATIVMLSEIGDGERKCPRYWDDDTVQYEHISVQYEHSESCPYYTRRDFRVTNTKSGETSAVQQLQYHGWPTVSGQVPEVTRGLAELADAASRRPLLVHCQLGTERSSMFVALCILILQLRTERRVDVSCVARKVRSQRARTLDTFLQYEFLHRAILNYAELHSLLEDS